MYRMVHSRTVRRQELLDAVVTELQRGGIGDRSLRDIIHHFGSRDGLFTDVVRRVEEDQRRFLETLDAPPEQMALAMWQRLSDPQLWPAERLFFECYARASRGEEPYASLLPGLVDDWLDRVVALGHAGDSTDPGSRARVRLSLALVRGLLLDLVGTEDREGVDAAFEQYRALEAIAMERNAGPVEG